MCSECNGFPATQGVSRGRFLSLAGSSLAAVALLGRGGIALAAEEKTFEPEVSAVSEEFGVPEELLLAMGYVNTLWEMPPPAENDYDPGEHGGFGTYGVMQLAQNPDRDTLGRAASLTGLSEKELKNDLSANLRGGAAVLADIQGEDKPDNLDGWRESVARYADTDLYATEVYEALKEGAALTISSGEWVSLKSQDVEVPVLFQAQSASDYRRATWRPAHGSNYTNASREKSHNINKIVLHIGEGSYSGIYSWFQNPSANVSAHYVVGRDGAITQMVRHADIGWHSGNWNYNATSVGIEHAGYASNSNNWTAAMYRASARLSAYISKRHRIPVDKQHFVLHRNVPGIPPRSCPGYYFNLDRYLRLVRQYRGATGVKYRQVVDNSSARFSAPRAWDANTYNRQKYGKNYRAVRPSRRGAAKFKLKIPKKAQYIVYAWWPASLGYNDRTRFQIRTANGWRRRIVNQRINGGKWVRLGKFTMNPGDRVYVKVPSRSSGNGWIVADAVKVIRR